MSVYLDNNATTPLDGRVLEEMLPYMRGEFGNPSSASHAFGWTAEAAVEVARERVAAAVGAEPDEIIFTSGATESDNLAIRGVIGGGDHLLTAATEHEAVLNTAKFLQSYGIPVGVLPVDESGAIAPEELKDALLPETALVSVMLANNETGFVQDVAALAGTARERGIPFHTDAAQALGRVPLDVRSLNVSMMSLSAHKAHGPKGVGALFVERSLQNRLTPLFTGGGQEGGLRGGTLNVPGIVGFGKAAELASAGLEREVERQLRLKVKLCDLLRSGLSRSGVEIKVNGGTRTLAGTSAETLPNTLSVRFVGLDAGEVLAACPEVAASTGSACASRDPEPSHVLVAMGLEKSEIASTIRFSTGRFTTEDEIESAAKAICSAVAGMPQTNFR